MKISKGLFFILIIISFFNSLKVFSKQLNYMQSNLLRLSSQNRTESWIVPFYGKYKRSPPNIQFNIFGIINPDVLDVIDEIGSKDQDIITKRINSSFGKPYDFSFKMELQAKIGPLIQAISTNLGAVVAVSNPDFPKLELLFYQDYFITSSYLYTDRKRVSIKPKLGYGNRKILESSFTALELAEDAQISKVGNQPWKFVAEFGLEAEYKYDSVDLLFELNSFPLIKTKYRYWDTNLGVRSNNLSGSLGFFEKVYFYLLFSPLYDGEYDMIRTVKAGTNIHFLDHVVVDLFLEDKLSLGVIAKIHFRYFDINFISREKSYDNENSQQSRQYGLDIKFCY